MKKILITLFTLVCVLTASLSVEAFNGPAMRRAASAGATAPSPAAATNSDNTTVYLPTLGDQGNTGHEITVKGTPILKSFNAEGNSLVNYSGFFNGADAQLTVPDSTDWDHGTGVTMEGWFFPISLDSGITFLGQRFDGSSYNIIWMPSATTIGWYVSNNAALAITSTTLPSLNKWNHIAAVKNGTTYNLYLNGVSIASGTEVGTLLPITAPFRVGYRNAGGFFYGYTSAVAVHQTALYTTAFTPPKTIAEMTNDANTVLFVDFTETTQGATPATFTDSSVGGNGGAGHTVTNASSKVSGCTFWWDGAWEMDGSTDYLTVPDSTDWDIATGDFSIGRWATITSLASDQVFMGSSVDDSNRWDFRYSSVANELQFKTSAGTITTSGITLAANKMYYFELNRVSGQVDFYVDQTKYAGGADTSNLTTYSNGLEIGAREKTASFGLFSTGLLGELQFSDVARNTIAFVPATAKATSDANTKLLIQPSGNTAIGSRDKHDIEFADGIVLSTDVPSSTSFLNSWAYDGGDLNTILPADSVDFDINSTNANLIFWVKLNTHAAISTMLTQYQAPTDYWAAENVHGTGLRFRIRSSDTDIVTLAGSEIDDSQWYQYVVAKVGNDYGLYKALEGDSVATQVAFVTDSDTATNTGALLMGGKTVATDTVDGYLLGPILYNSNELGAAPNVGLTDTIPVITAPIQ